MTMYVYVGGANSRPDSRTPRRLAITMNANSASESPTSWPRNPDTAEVMAATPAAIETETVSV